MSEEGRTVFNGRYELLRRIARGGMADVYLARDVSLDRQVAVKVLFSEFANDPSFVERFRREAKAAANLSHPNIIGIFDWGQEQGTYYIVMEYVEGRSMADVLRSTGPLSPDRAAEIASNVADALASAHSAGLVHRDVKLGNIIVSDEGQVKVADFGIATALARRTGDNLTQIGSVMGTATYFSPEQAQGKPLDGRSDLYSLGVVLYEMIVGRPPFAADTPTAVAVKHVQESPQRPSQAGANIAESLEAIILKLLAKNPGNRYPEAADLRSDLRRYLSGAHRIPKRPGAATPSGAGQTDPASDSQRRRAGPSAPEGASAAEGGPSRQRTARGAARGPSTPSAHDAPRPPSGPGVPWSQRSPTGASSRAQSEGAGGRRSTGRYPAGAGGARPPSGPPGAVAGDAPGPPEYMQPAYYYEEVHRSDSWKRTAMLLVLLAVLAAVLGVLVVYFYRALGIDDEAITPTFEDDDNAVELVEVPDLSGANAGDAQTALRSLGLEIEIDYQENVEVPEGTVFSQSPLAGQRVQDGETVFVSVSQGEISSVPSVQGLYIPEARSALTEAGYTVIEVESVAPAERGVVVGQDPRAGAELPAGGVVTLTVSTGPGQLLVPDVRGESLIDAIQTLIDRGLRVAERREPSTTVEEGAIIDTDPTRGTPVKLESVVYIITSTGPPLVAIPDVKGLLFDTGKLTLERRGLMVGLVTFEPVEPGSPDVGRILGQTPPPNLDVGLDTSVDLVVGQVSEDETPPTDTTIPDDANSNDGADGNGTEGGDDQGVGGDGTGGTGGTGTGGTGSAG